MDADKLLDVIAIYRKNFIRKKIEVVDFSHIDKPIKYEEILSHCHGMLNKMEKFVLEGRIEKAFRWLGFVQGCLWSVGYYSLEDLKSHNRPTIKKLCKEVKCAEEYVDHHLGCPAWPNCDINPAGCSVIMGNAVEWYGHRD